MSKISDEELQVGMRELTNLVRRLTQDPVVMGKAWLEVDGKLLPSIIVCAAPEGTPEDKLRDAPMQVLAILPSDELVQSMKEEDGSPLFHCITPSTEGMN